MALASTSQQTYSKIYLDDIIFLFFCPPILNKNNLLFDEEPVPPKYRFVSILLTQTAHR
jgi:hypothetical protein